MSLITAAALASGLLVPTEASLPPQPHMILALNPSRSRRGARRSNAFTPAGRTRGAIEISRPSRNSRTRSRPRRNTSNALSVLPVDESRHHAARLLGLISLLETFDAGAKRLIQSHVLPIADQLLLQPHGLRTSREQCIEARIDGGIERGRRDHLLDQAPRERGRGIDVLAPQQKLARAAPADQPGQQRRFNDRRN